MDISLGTVVKSKAGRDKDTFLIVVKKEGKYAFVCDGGKRPLERPKKKNLSHLAATCQSIPVNELTTNHKVKAFLKAISGRKE